MWLEWCSNISTRSLNQLEKKAGSDTLSSLLELRVNLVDSWQFPLQILPYHQYVPQSQWSQFSISPSSLSLQHKIFEKYSGMKSSKRKCFLGHRGVIYEIKQNISYNLQEHLSELSSGSKQRNWEKTLEDVYLHG